MKANNLYFFNQVIEIKNPERGTFGVGDVVVDIKHPITCALNKGMLIFLLNLRTNFYLQYYAPFLNYAVNEKLK